MRAFRSIWRVAALVVVLAMVGSACGTSSSDGHGARAQNDVVQAGATTDTETSAVSTFFGSLGGSVLSSVTDNLVGWGMGALGLNDGQGDDFAKIASELNDISQQLSQIDTELKTIDSDIKQQTCDLETYDTTTQARAQIDSVQDQYTLLLQNGGSPSDVQDFVNQVFDKTNGGVNSIDKQLNTINDAMLSAGDADGIIAACLKALDPPAAQTVDDRPYYAKVANLTNFFYGYQVKGLALLTEAYHYEAYVNWAVANDPTTLSGPSDLPTICDGATGEVATECGDARSFVDLTYKRLQDQYSLAGAPYSTDDYKILNQTPYVWVMSLEDFTKAAGASCSYPLSSSNRCGPTAGTNTLTSFQANGKPVVYGEYNTWKPANPKALTALLAGASTSDPVSKRLGALGFANPGDKILYTNQLQAVYVNDDKQQFFVDQGVCFVDTSVDQSHATQPFCSNLASLMANDAISDNCAVVRQSGWVPDTALYKGEYDTGINVSTGQKTCNHGWHGNPPGYFADPGHGMTKELLWPMIDTSAVTCEANEDGSARSQNNAAGVPTMCGRDFDAWFEQIVPNPFPQ